jgi:hypothetical protein
MVVVSLTQRPKFRANEARKRAVCRNDHDQARRDNKETEAGHVAS